MNEPHMYEGHLATYSKSNKSPKTDPCGTPQPTDLHDE